MKFTKTSVAALALEPGQSERKVWDTECHGLGVRLRASGSAYWVVQPPRKGGKSSVFTLGTVSAIPLATARLEAAKRIANVTLGVDVTAEREAAKARSAVTFGSVLPRYLARAESRLRASSFGDVKRYLDVQSKTLHALPLADIKRAQVATLLSEIAAKSGPFASNRARAALSAFFSWAAGEGLTEINPVIGTNKAAAEIFRERTLTDAELRAIWLACDDGDFGRIVQLLILTGQRREEVAGIRWSELDLQGAAWSLPSERTKNNRRHDIPLSAAALSILGSVPVREGRNLLFGQRAGGFSGFSKAKAELDARTGISTAWVLHDLRRTAATGMANLRVLPHVVEAVLNHVSGHKAGVAGVYNRASYATEKRDALDRWAAHVLIIAQSIS
ncbi:tyrosine-type recombinase/integrase [Methylobacterium sp. M6A4_1b]